MPLKIIALQAENYKRLRAVTIRPNPDDRTVVVSGRNAAGKTSVLDAIWAAFAGGEASRATAQPIRDGEDTAYVSVDLGEYVVTRRWTKDDAGSLTVQAKDGAKYSSPQKLLDELLGRRSFDPYAFLSLDAKKQVGVLLEVLGDDLTIDPATVDAERRGIFDTRTDTGREVKKLEGQLAGYPLPDASLPREEVSAAAVLAEEDAARAHNAAHDIEIDRLAHCESEVERCERDAQLAQVALNHARVALDAAELALSRQREKVMALPKRIDTAAIREKLATVEQTNARIRQEQHRRAVAEELSDRKQEVAQLTLRLREIDEKKSTALAAATSKLPVPGINIDESGLTFRGIPFSQASHAEQLRVATALSMAFHPELRVLRIDNGESLDAESLGIIEDLARENDYQVWVSRVSDGPGAGIFIEEGAVRA